MIRWSGILLALVAALTIAATATATLYALIASEAGSRWLLSRALPMAVADARFDTMAGTLTEGVTLRGLHLPLEGIDIKLASIRTRWQLWDILGGQFPVEEIAVKDAVVRITPQPDTGEPPAWPSLAVPFPVRLQSVEVDGLTMVTVGDGTEDSQTIDRIALALEAGPLHTRIRHLEVAMDDSRLQLAGRIGNRFPYSLVIDLDWYTRLGGEQFQGSGGLSGNLEKLNLEHRLDHPYRLATEGAIRPGFTADGGPVLDIAAVRLEALHSRWRELALPAANGEPITTSGELTLDGHWRNYRLALDGDLQSPQGPLQVRLRGRGSAHALDLTDLALNSGAGTVTGTGSLDWEMPLRWQLALAIKQLQVGHFAPEWPATLSADLSTEGHWQQDDLGLAVTIDHLEGDVFEHRIRGRGSLALDNSLLSFRDLTLSVADNHLAANGSLGDTLDMTWQLEAPNLGAIHPAIAGAVHSTGTATGRFPDINVTTHTRARQLSAFSVKAENLDLRLQPATDNRYRLDLEGRDIAAPGLAAGDIRLEGTGTIDSHRLSLAANSGDLGLELAVAGGLGDNSQWSGTLSKLAVTHPLSGRWQQRGDSQLVISTEQLALDSFRLDTFCLWQGTGNLCTRLTATPEALSLNTTVGGVSLAIIKAWLPPTMTVTGTVEGTAELSGPYRRLSGEVALAVPDTRLHYQPPAGTGLGNNRALSHNADIAVNARLDDGNLTGKAHIEIADTGRLGADVSFNPQDDSDPLTGTVTGGFDNLRWLDGFFPVLENLDGTLAVDLAVSGEPGAATITGDLGFDDLGLQLPVAGIQLEQGRGTLTLSPQGGWRLDAGIRSGDGKLAIAGSGELALPDFIYGDLKITGDNFRLANLPDFSAVVAPAIDLSLSREAIDITGVLSVTDGHLNVRTMDDQGVAVTDDERIDSDKDSETSPARPINTRLQLKLADSFRLSGYGLTARLGGDMQLSQRADQPPRAVGTIHIYDGVYRAYGQQLNVEQGQLIFQGPLENPGLNITAVRETPFARVGLRIGGFANDIRSEVFSDPSLPSSEAIAILVTGKPMNDMTESDANQVANAAAALGISQSKWVTRRLRESIGLDVVDIQGGDDYTESSLVVGKYLTPNIFISYVQNLFTPEGSVELDYSLTDWLGLKARSGETQSLDLMFRLEHGPPREQKPDQ